MKWLQFGALIWMCACTGGGHIATTRAPYDLQALLRLAVYRDMPLDGQLAHRYVLITYFNDMTCETCLTRELSNLKAFHETHGDRLGFLMAVYDERFRQLGDPSPHVDTLRRVGRITYPILLEKHRQEAGLGHAFNIGLIDAAAGEVVVRYFPQYGHDEWPAFQKKVEHAIRASRD